MKDNYLAELHGYVVVYLSDQSTNLMNLQTFRLKNCRKKCRQV